MAAVVGCCQWLVLGKRGEGRRGRRGRWKVKEWYDEEIAFSAGASLRVRESLAGESSSR